MAGRDEERGEIEDRSAPRAAIVHEAVREQGREEPARPAGSLFWSGVAAGIAIAASVIAQGALHHELPAGMEARTFVSQLGYPLGVLIAAVARLRAVSSGAEFWIVIVLGDFTHVVAGAAEAFLLLVSGEAGPARVFGGMILPALIGNLVGGTGLFALLAHAQVRQEL